MKKRIIIIAMGMMAMWMAACGNSEGSGVPTPTPEAVPTERIEATFTPTPEPTATTAPRMEDTYEKGVVTESGFESEWMNLRFTTQPGVYMYTQEELDILMRQGVENAYGDNAEAILNYVELTTVTEMMAQYVSGANVIVQTERLPVLQGSMTVEEYLTAVIKNLKNNAAIFKAETDEEFYTVEIGGEKYTGVSVAVDYGTGEMIGQEYLIRKKESRMIAVIVTYTEASMEEAKNLMNAFGSYDSEPVVLPEPTPYPSTYEPGILSENSFESEWLNLRFTATKDVIMKTRQEIADTLPFGAAIIFGDDAEDRLESSKETLYIEMMAVHKSEGSVLVQTEVLPAGYEAASAEVYLATIMNDLKNAASVTYTVDEEIYEVEIAGENYIGFSAMVDVLGEKLYQEMLCRKKENRIISMVISYEKETMENAQYLLTLFGTYDSEPVDLPEPTAAPTETPAVSAEGYNAGTWNGFVYENPWLGFKFNVPEGATYSTPDSGDTVSIEATWPEGLPIVQVMVEEMIYEGMTAEEYAEALKLALKDMASSGITYTFDENLYVAEFAGQEYINLACNAETGGISLYQDYCLREKDGYIVAIIITYADGYESYLQSVLDAFTAY